MFQGYDSVEVKADIELGGSDQKFNLLMGRQLQKAFGQKPQIVMTLPLLVGLDGTQKMSKSLGNFIAVNDSPKDMFGKSMSIPDALMKTYFDLLTEIDGAAVEKEVASGALHPRDAKVRLGKTIVSVYYGEAAAEAEVEEFNRIFRDKQAPENPVEKKVPAGEIWIVDLIKIVGAATTNGDARRLVEQGGVTFGGVKLSDPKANVIVTDGLLLKAGKKTFIRLKI
jgi:tyrosyl-tRNA synthetase